MIVLEERGKILHHLFLIAPGPNLPDGDPISRVEDAEGLWKHLGNEILSAEKPRDA